MWNTRYSHHFIAFFVDLHRLSCITLPWENISLHSTIQLTVIHLCVCVTADNQISPSSLHLDPLSQTATSWEPCLIFLMKPAARSLRLKGKICIYFYLITLIIPLYSQQKTKNSIRSINCCQLLFIITHPELRSISTESFCVCIVSLRPLGFSFPSLVDLYLQMFSVCA